MAIPTMQYQNELAAQRFANALYDMQLGTETLDYVLNDFDNYGVEAVLNSYFDFSFGSAPVADVAASMVSNLGIEVGENNIDQAAYDAALAYVVAELEATPAAERGAKAGEIIEMWANGFDNAAYDDAIAAFNAEVETAMEYTGAEDVTVGTDTVVTDFYLTASQDILQGTMHADNFDASLSQNQWSGGVSNTLSSSDVLDGGAGEDVLNADIVPEFFGASGNNQMDIQPTIRNIETIELEAKDYNAESGENDGNVIFDAKNVTDVVNIGSSYSDGDLVIENLTTLTSEGTERNTDSITVTMDHTDNSNSDGDASDLHVYFDEDYLLSGKSAESFVEYFLLDQDADQFNTDVDGDGVVDLLANINTNGLRFTVDGVEQVVEFDKALLENGDILNHDDFVAALQPSLQQLIADGLVPADTTLTLDPAITRTTYLDDGTVSSQIPAIVLKTESTTKLEEVGFKWVDDLVGDYNVYGRMNDDASESPDPVGVNVDLHKVGREGLGGDLIIGGKQDEGIPDFYVSVLGDNDQPSNLGTITTNANDLENIYIETADEFRVDTDGDGDIDNDDVASLTIRDGFTNQESVDLVDADDFLGDLTLGNDTPVQDLVTLTAQGGGDVDFTGYVDASGKAYSYMTGSGDDVIDVTLDGDAVDTIGESFAISTKNGDDDVTINAASDVTPEAIEGVSQNTMQMLHNLSIDTGAGDDNVEVNDYQNFNIDTGAGDDFVYINSQGTAGAAANSVYVSAPATAAWGTAFTSRVLYKAELTLTFAGFESKVTVPTDNAGNFVADQVVINEAIMNAIDESPVLSKLLEYELGDGNQALFVRSTVDGENDFQVELFQPELVASNAATGQVVLNAGDENSLLQGIIATDATEDSATDPMDYVNENDGLLTDSTWTFNANATGIDNVNFSRIDTGRGANDIVVLDSNELSANIIEIDQQFDKLSVVNFFDANGEVGNHLIDYTYYLDNQVDPTDNDNIWSAQNIDVELNNDAIAEANTVSMLSFDAAETDSITWANLNASNLVSALNGDATDVIGGLTDGSLDAVGSTTNLIGNVQDHIVMVENARNDGEYKVFYLTSTFDSENTTEGEFDTDATMLGTLDFGDSINFPLWGNPQNMATYNALIDGADAGEAPQENQAPEVSVNVLMDTLTEGEYNVGDVVATFSTTDVDDTTAPVVTLQQADGTACNCFTVDNKTNEIIVAQEGEITQDFTQQVVVVATDAEGAQGTASFSVDYIDVPDSQDGVVDIAEGTTAPVEATAAAEIFSFDMAAALALEDNTQIDITGFDTANDSLELDIATAGGVSTLDELNGVDGIAVQENVITNETLINFGSDANGDVVGLTLVGVSDASLVSVEAV